MLTAESRTERAAWKSLSYSFQGDNSALPGWERDGTTERVWLRGSACACLGLAGRCMYTLQGVLGWMCMAVIPFNTQRASWTNLIQQIHWADVVVSPGIMYSVNKFTIRPLCRGAGLWHLGQSQTWLWWLALPKPETWAGVTLRC